VVLDEIHTLQPSKRGDLLSLGLARLQSFAPAMRRVGLSATVNDPDMLRRWLGPGASPLPTEAADPGEVDLVMGDPGAPPVIDVLLSEGRVPWHGWTAAHAIPEVYEAIRQSKTALVFVNTRWQSEFGFQELWRINEDNLPIALHHGSLSAEQRRKVEAAMAAGKLRAVVATSTLDLGIDWGAVDLVIQLSAPKGSSRLVQRIGRANHRLDEPSRAILVPASRFEMLECQAAKEAVAVMDLDGEPARTGAQDVLAQHVMGVACGDPFDADALYTEVRTSAPFAELTREDFDRVVAFVSDGGYALKTYDRFKRIVKGRDGLWARAQRPDSPAAPDEHGRDPRRRLAQHPGGRDPSRPSAARWARRRSGISSSWRPATPSCSAARSGASRASAGWTPSSATPTTRTPRSPPGAGPSSRSRPIWPSACAP
jgi:ATP-dependent Lhr-like helicase